MSPLVLGETLGVFVDTLPADAKYPVEYFLDSTSNFKHFKEKDDGHS